MKQENTYINPEEWKDVQGIQQYDGNPPILGIKYAKDYEEMMDIFRAIIKSGEISKRVFKLTYPIIKKLPSNYNVWFVRRKCVTQLGIELLEEIKYLNSITGGNEKVYQIWEYRRQLIEQIGSPEGEINFLHLVFDVDNKNYHAWSYRIWLCSHFNLFQQELKEINYFIEEDIGNNSAWNYRYFLRKSELDSTLLKDELQYIFSQISIKPTNESSWNYLRGWFKNFEFKFLKTEEGNKEFKQFNYQDNPEVQKFVEQQCTENRNRFSIGCLINIYMQLGEKEYQVQAIKVLIIDHQLLSYVKNRSRHLIRLELSTGNGLYRIYKMSIKYENNN